MPPKRQAASPPRTRRGTVRGAPTKPAQGQASGQRKVRAPREEQPKPKKTAPKRAAAPRGSSGYISPLALPSRTGKGSAVKPRCTESSSSTRSSLSSSPSHSARGDSRDRTIARLRRRLERRDSRRGSSGSPHGRRRGRSSSSSDHRAQEGGSRSSSASTRRRGRSPRSSSSDRYKSDESPESRRSRHRGRKPHKSRRRGHKSKRDSSGSPSSSDRYKSDKSSESRRSRHRGRKHHKSRRRGYKSKRDSSGSPSSSDGAFSRPSTRGRSTPRSLSGGPLGTWTREVTAGVLSALAPSTLQSYTRAWSQFEGFRDKFGLRRRRAAKEHDVLKYLVHLKRRGMALKTISLHKAAISYFSNCFWFPDPCNTFHVRKLIAGWRRSHPPIPDKRRPVTIEILQTIWDALPSICWSNYEVRLFRAAFSLAFFGALRIGECVGTLSPHRRGLSVADINLDKRMIQVKIRTSKTDQLGRGSTLSLASSPHTGPCPVADTRKFLKVRPPGPGPLLIHASGRPMTRCQFVSILRKAIHACGGDPAQFSGHSFRIGAATTAAASGLPAEHIKTMGRWRSAAFKGYIRHNQQALTGTI
uniref:uncharacterized protein LOC114597557 n=1 Tax=Podarcis muralis TaxID=64176 RepID=UPI00109FAED7|nr:uncharacterized protein LOC114597557 [Podarcis muralis]XP_028605271.1 uncharacterized protein LOC114606843 [Podarcis muralis]